MTLLKGKTALVTGASSGIGKETVKLFLEKGIIVYAAARRIEQMKDLEDLGAHIISMDVCNEQSVISGVETILKENGSIDILINNAGYGSYGAIEDVPLDEARRQFDVNIFGLARLSQLVLPGMRKNNFGKIVNISSIGGKMYTAFGGWYHATKHALEGFSDCLRLETRPFGVDVIIVEPGGIATPWGSIAADNLRKTSGSGAYSERALKSADSMQKMYTNGSLSDPLVIGKTILRAVSAKRPKTRYAAGYLSGISLFMRKILSDRAFDKIIQSVL